MADTSGKFRAKAYHDKLANDEKVKFHVQFEQIAGAGAILNETRYRKEGPNLHAIKYRKHRLLCFHDGRDIMIAHGIKKKDDKDKRHARALQFAEQMCRQFHDEVREDDDGA